MSNLKFVKNGETHLFRFRNNKMDIHALKLNSQYIDLTTNPNLSSFTKVKFNINGVSHYLRDKYFNHSGVCSSGNYTNKAFKPSRPIKHEVRVPISNYVKYKIVLNGNFDVMSWFDFNNSSYAEGSYFRGNFLSVVKPQISGGHHSPNYKVSWCNDPDDFDMSDPASTMNGQITLNGSIHDLTSTDKQIFYKKLTNGVGDGTYINFRIYAKVDNTNIIITYGWWVSGYDERCSGNVSYSIKIGVATHE